MNSNKISYFFLALAAILSIAAVVLLFTRARTDKPAAPKIAKDTTPAETIEKAEPIEGIEPPMKPQTSEEIMKDLGIGLSTANPSELLEKIGNALEQDDLISLAKLIGNKALDAEKLEQLRALSQDNRLTISTIREIGELEINQRTRWAIELQNRENGNDRILLDLKKVNGKWTIEDLTLPPTAGATSAEPTLTDSLNTADAFLTSVLSQDFEAALNFIDTEKISEAKIAALCILFEEGDYKLRKQRPLRAMFSTPDTAGFIANVITSDAQTAQFSLNLRRPSPNADWKLIEINLDSLLTDYANRYADGDIYYSPLVKNPAGGETLALYFEFDAAEINPRTRRQLDIVANMLKSDGAKKITLSGHTDALGTDDYNNTLSANRAQTVRDFLAAAGVSQDQIITQAKGASQPRRPNITETGEDNPYGRRANRRTEIYLDF